MTMGEIQRYTEIALDYYDHDMFDWCNNNIPGYGRLVEPSFYFDFGYSWFAKWPVLRYRSPGIIFSFARPEDAVLFALRWSR